jgi:hypothetical protein
MKASNFYVTGTKMKSHCARTKGFSTGQLGDLVCEGQLPAHYVGS